MYRIYDKSEAIKRVQSYLRAVGRSDILILPTGVYDENTRNSVIYFQAENKIQVTGEVDKETFDLLYGKYMEVMSARKISENTSNKFDFPILPGDHFAEMLNINHALASLLDYYGQYHSVRITTYYSNESVAAVNDLKKIYMLPINDTIDAILYSRMMMDLASINNFR